MVVDIERVLLKEENECPSYDFPSIRIAERKLERENDGVMIPSFFWRGKEYLMHSSQHLTKSSIE